MNKLAGIAVATLLASFAPQPREASAATIYPKSTSYQVKFVRANDACTGPGDIVVNPGGIIGCTRANVITDSLVNFQQAALKVSVSNTKGASFQLKGKGFVPSGQEVGIRLTLRTSNTLQGPDLTFQDTTIICGPTSGSICGKYVAVDADGKVKSGKLFLADCMTSNGVSTTLAHGNIEIVDAALINCDDGKVFGTPGIQQQ